MQQFQPRQVQFDGPEKTFIFHPLFASENFAEDKVGASSAMGSCFLREQNEVRSESVRLIDLIDHDMNILAYIPR